MKRSNAATPKNTKTAKSPAGAGHATSAKPAKHATVAKHANPAHPSHRAQISNPTKAATPAKAAPSPKPTGGAAPDLSVEFCGVRFLNPFLLSSSPVSNCAEMIQRAFDAGWGGVAYKTLVTDRIPIYHPSPRMHGYHYGDTRLVGLQNVEQTTDRGLKPNLRDITYLKKKYPKHIVLASIMGFSNQEWADLAKAVTDAGADMIELNFSCPHMTVEGSGAKVGKVNDLVEKFTATVRGVTRLPLVAKMTPNITDMVEPALSAKRGGADALSAINTVAGLSEVGLNDWIPRPNVFGKGAISGYSGPAVKPIGLRFIAQLASHPKLRLPLSGMGGIETWIDVLEYLLVGASTVQVTTGIIHYGYRIVEDMIEGVTDYMKMKGVKRLADLVGKALPHLHETGDFDVKRQGIAQYDTDRCVGCGQCYIVCQDAGGQALAWDSATRRPTLDKDKCLSCMVCSFVCPVSGTISYREMPKSWKRCETLTLGR
jgi:dihydropyrimidine dehydrogenase (NAD+) subunit PreA